MAAGLSAQTYSFSLHCQKGGCRIRGLLWGQDLPTAPPFMGRSQIGLQVCIHLVQSAGIKLHKHCCSDLLSCRISLKWPLSTVKRTHLWPKPSPTVTVSASRMLIQLQCEETACFTEGMETLTNRCERYAGHRWVYELRGPTTGPRRCPHSARTAALGCQPRSYPYTARLQGTAASEPLPLPLPRAARENGPHLLSTYGNMWLPWGE